MWLVLDWDGPIDLAAIKRAGGALVGDVTSVKLDSGQAIRIRLNRPQLAALVAGGSDNRTAGWTVVLSDAAQSVPLPLDALRNMAEPGSRQRHRSTFEEQGGCTGWSILMSAIRFRSSRLRRRRAA